MFSLCRTHLWYQKSRHRVCRRTRRNTLQSTRHRTSSSVTASSPDGPRSDHTWSVTWVPLCTTASPMTDRLYWRADLANLSHCVWGCLYFPYVMRVLGIWLITISDKPRGFTYELSKPPGIWFEWYLFWMMPKCLWSSCFENSQTHDGWIFEKLRIWPQESLARRGEICSHLSKIVIGNRCEVIVWGRLHLGISKCNLVEVHFWIPWYNAIFARQHWGIVKAFIDVVQNHTLGR